MTKRTSFLMRFLALALALVMFASSSNLGLVLQAFASEGQTITDGELIASNYALSDAEKDLLESGLLGGASHSYEVPNLEELITIDSEAKTVTAESKDGWTPATAELFVGGEAVQNIDLPDGKGSFTTDELVYAVVVHYELHTTAVTVETQKAMLAAPALLKQGLANLKAGYAAEGNMGAVVEAKSVLLDMSAEFGAEAQAAISALYADTGIAALQSMNAAYDAAAAKTEYLMVNGAAYAAKTAEVCGYLKAVNSDALMSNENVDAALKLQDEMNGTNNAVLWGTFKEILSILVSDLEKVANADWTLPTILPENVDYAALEAAVNAIEQVSSVEVKSELYVAAMSATKQSDNALTVTVNVVLKAVENNAVVEISEHTDSSLTVAKTATEAEILAAIEAKAFEAGVVAAWGEPYVAEHFQRSAKLEGAVYTVTYAPKDYIITYSYAEAETVPYGTTVELPEHDDETKAYDYIVNGEALAQGSVITITGDTEITRSTGKAYKVDSLYSIIGKNAKDPVVQAILGSGALKGDYYVSARQPDVSEAGELLTLLDNTLTAKNYASDYKGLYWTPYSYGEKGTEELFSGNSASWSNVEAKVVYRLWLNGVDGNAIVELAKTLKADADAQTDALERLKVYGTETYDANGERVPSDLESLNSTLLGSIIGGIAWTDLTPGDNTDKDAKNLELRVYFTDLITSINTNNMTSGNLTLYKMVSEYRSGRLGYYYRNAEAVRKEVLDLSASLSGLVGDADKEKGLEVLLKAYGKADYVEKIAKLGTAMAEIAEGLSLPNEKIDVNSSKLGTLIEALGMEEEIKAEEVKVPYMESNTLSAKDPTTKNIQVVVSVGAESDTAATVAFPRGTIISAETINALKADIEAIFNRLAKENAPYYVVSTEDGSVESLIGKALDEDIVLYYEYTPRQYTVKIEGEADQTISVRDMSIDLPANTKAGCAWEYSVKGEVITVRTQPVTVTFKLIDLATLFINGSYTITRVENNEEQEKIENAFTSDLTKIEWNEDKTEILSVTANVTANEMMAFATQLMQSGFSYIELNGNKMMYKAEDGATRISVQALLDAIMADEGFTSQRVIELGQKGSGLLLNAKMSLGYAADDISAKDVPFIMNLKSVPGQMVTVANGLNAVKNYFSFQSNPAQGYMDVKLNLPDAVYEVYLTALLATNTLDKTDVNAINHAIAYNFLADYVKLVMSNDDITTTTFENTVNMMLKEFNDLPVADLSWDKIEWGEKAEKYYQLVRTALNGPSVDITANENDYTIDVCATDDGINQVLSLLGLNIDDVYKAQIAEMQPDGQITAKAVAVLDDANTDFEAIVIDLHRTGAATQTLKRIYDFTDDLPARVAELGGETVIMLLDTVDGDLNIAQSGIIDLNGQTINGKINFTGRKLIVTDSSLNTVSGATVTGEVIGDVVTLAGTYGTVTEKMKSWLPDGYYFDENGTVRNALYTYVNGNIVVDTNKLFDEAYVTGYLPNVQYMATDIAFNFILNYYTAASLNIEGNDICKIDFNDLVGGLGAESNRDKLENVVDALLEVIRFDAAQGGGTGGIDNFINELVVDLLDFDQIYEAVKNGTAIGDYTITTGAWSADVKHIADEDYITVGLVSDMANAKTTKMSLSFEGTNKERTLRYISELARIVVVGENDTHFVVDLDQPYRDVRNLVLAGGVDAGISIDLSGNCNYNRILAGLLAYFNEDLTETLVKDGCILELNEVMSEVTMGQLVDAIEKAVENFDAKYGEKIDFAIIAKRLKLNISDTRIESINNLYDRFINIVGRVFVRFDMSKYSDYTLENLFNDGEAALDVDSQRDYNVDAFYRSYGVEVDLKPSKLVLKLKMADKCDGIWGDVNRDGKINIFDAALVVQYAYGNVSESHKYKVLHLCVADVNGDNKVNIFDYSLIIQRAYGNLNKFPVED